jgi:hypothetical protein
MMCELQWTAKKAVFSSNVLYDKKTGLVASSQYASNTASWTSNELPLMKSITSDARLKENVMKADLEQCYNTVKDLPLMYYKWKDEVHSWDRHRLGWIAQDVEAKFPKAITKRVMHGLPDCRTMSEFDIFCSLYGTVQKLQGMVEDQAASIAVLQEKLNQK